MESGSESDAVATNRRATDAVERRDWAAAYEVLRAIDVPNAAELELMADVARWSRPGGEQVDLLERAHEAFLRAGDPYGAARVSLQLCREHFERGDISVAAGCLGRATSLLADLPESAEHAFLAWNLARAAFNVGDVDALIEKAKEAAEIAHRVGNRDVEALARLDTGHALVASGRFDEGMALIDEANAAAASGTLGLEAAGTIYCSTIWSCRNLGDWRRAAAWTDVSLRWCERQHVSGFPGQCRFHRAEVLRMRGALDDAEVDARRAIEELIDRPLYAGWGYMELGEIRRRRGDLEAADEAFRAAIDLGTDPQPGYALLRLAIGDVAGARSMIERALAPANIIAREERVLVLPAAVTIALAASEIDTAKVHLAELEDLANRLGTPHAQAAALGASGQLALAEGRTSDAVEQLRGAWEAWCLAEAPYEAATMRVLVGRAHLTAADEAAARIELSAALSTFERLGAHRDAEEVRGLLLSPTGDSRPASVHATFAFVDMVSSTPLVEILGDGAWADLLAWYERTLIAEFEGYGGKVVQQGGDGFFVIFNDAEAGLDCAVAIQQTLAAHRHDHGFAPRVRIGLHTADALRRGDDYAGLSVHAAARIAAGADAEQIVASRQTIMAGGKGREVSEPRKVMLKGLSGPVEVVTVAWR